jgi:hypothetical protein
MHTSAPQPDRRLKGRPGIIGQRKYLKMPTEIRKAHEEHFDRGLAPHEIPAMDELSDR